MINKVCEYHTKRFLEATKRGEIGLASPQCASKMLENLFGIPNHLRLLVLCCSGAAGLSFGQINRNLTPLRYFDSDPSAYKRLVNAYAEATRMTVQFDVAVIGTTFLTVNIFFYHQGRNAKPIIGVLGAVDPEGIQILRLMTDEEIAGYCTPPPN